MTKQTAIEYVSALDQVRRRNDAKAKVLASLAAAAYKLRQDTKDVIEWGMLYTARSEYMAEAKKLNADLAQEIYNKGVAHD